MAKEPAREASARELAEQWQHLDEMVERQTQRLLIRRDRKQRAASSAGEPVFNPNTGEWSYSVRPLEQPADARVPLPAPWKELLQRPPQTAPAVAAAFPSPPLSATAAALSAAAGAGSAAAGAGSARPGAPDAPARSGAAGEAAWSWSAGSLPDVPPARLPLLSAARGAVVSGARSLRERLAALESALKAATERSAGVPPEGMTEDELLALLAERDRLLGHWVAAEAAAREALEEAIAERDRLADEIAAKAGLPASESSGAAEEPQDGSPAR